MASSSVPTKSEWLRAAETLSIAAVGALALNWAGFPAGLYVTVPKGQGASLKARIESLQPLIAPLHAGQTLGTLNLELDGKPYHSLPVVALEDVAVAGIIGRAWDALRLSIKW